MRISLPFYDLLAPIFAKHTELNKKNQILSKGERNAIWGGNVHGSTDSMFMFVKQAQEKDQRVENTEKLLLS